MNFAERLQAAMGRANATPKAVASALGVSVQAISQTLSGATRALTAENCAKAARFLQVDLYWLATGLGEMRPAADDLAMSLSPEERDFILALRLLPQPERSAVVADVMQRARSQLGHIQAMLHKHDGQTAEVVPLPRRIT